MGYLIGVVVLLLVGGVLSIRIVKQYERVCRSASPEALIKQ